MFMNYIYIYIYLFVIFTHTIYRSEIRHLINIYGKIYK